MQPSVKSKTETSGKIWIEETYLLWADGNSDADIRICETKAGEVVGKNRFAKLSTKSQEYVIPLTTTITEWFKITGDVVQDKFINWICDNVVHPWSIKVIESEDDDGYINFFVEYSFKNTADAVAFKLRWNEFVYHE